MATCIRKPCKTEAIKNSKFCAAHNKCMRSGCNAVVQGEGLLCKDHQKKKDEEDKKIAQQKEKAKQELADKQEEMKEMAAEATKKQQALDAKKVQITQLAGQWNNKVKEIVAKVKEMRKKFPKATNINAGKNGTMGTTLGGTDNPLTFTLPSSNPYKITKAEVFQKMTGFDSSDSGKFKFRVDGVLVHGD